VRATHGLYASSRLFALALIGLKVLVFHVLSASLKIGFYGAKLIFMAGIALLW